MDLEEIEERKRSDSEGKEPEADSPPIKPSTIKAKEKSKKGHQKTQKNQDEGYDVAIKNITLSPELLESLPRNIRNWNSTHAVAWLREVFAEAEALER